MGIMGIGTHEVEVAATGLTEKNGNLQINIGFVQPETGDTITAYLHTTDKAWPYTEEKLRNMGWDPVVYGFRFEDLNMDPSPMQGFKAQIVVESETHEGKTRNKVKWINVPGGGIQRLEPGEAQSFAAKLRARLTGQSYTPPAQSARGRNSSPPPQSAPMGDDDIPF